MKSHRRLLVSTILSLVVLSLAASSGRAANVTIDDSDSAQKQTIDGFGTCINNQGDQDWYQKAYYDDLGCSIMRMDISPQFSSPYSDHHYNSPWFGEAPPLKIDDASHPGGPEGNYVRTYTGPDDYTREFGGTKAQIAVMGPDIDKNMKFFDFKKVAAQGAMAKAGLSRKDQLGDFKLYGSMWSPAPWLKVANGQQWKEHHGIYPANGTPYPFIWNGCFAGGKVDTSDKPLDVFNDGTGPTSALTQLARSTAAFVKGFQDTYGVKFYAISIQNEVNFPEFYNSCVYATSDEYIAALKAVRKEFNQHPDLKDVQIIGPEDLLGNNYSMWQLGGGDKATHKNLQYLVNIQKDPEAAAAESFFCIHGYANDGASASGSDSKTWRMWAEGWTESPGPGIPPNVPGFTAYHKKSWMTETSGEKAPWLEPATGYPGNGGWSIAMKMQQALTVGQESACLYWQFADKDPNKTSEGALTRANDTTKEPKYVAAKHFIKYVRPGAVAVKADVDGAKGVTASAFLHKDNHTLTIVLVNKSADAEDASVQLPSDFSSVKSLDTATSSNGSLWQESKTDATGGQVKVNVPGYGAVTLYAKNS